MRAARRIETFRRNTARVAVATLLVATACSDDEGRAPRTAEAPATSPDAADAAPSPEASTTPLTGRALRRGGETWGVYFEVSELGDPDVERTAARLEAQGHEPSTLSLQCDRGAAEALGVPEQRAAVALYFASEQEARAFAATAQPRPDGVARVETLCID